MMNIEESILFFQDNTMVHYTGYGLADLEPVARKLNVMLRNPIYRNLSTILTKYTHP